MAGKNETQANTHTHAHTQRCSKRWNDSFVLLSPSLFFVNIVIVIGVIHPLILKANMNAIAHCLNNNITTAPSNGLVRRIWFSKRQWLRTEWMNEWADDMQPNRVLQILTKESLNCISRMGWRALHAQQTLSTIFKQIIVWFLWMHPNGNTPSLHKIHRIQFIVSERGCQLNGEKCPTHERLAWGMLRNGGNAICRHNDLCWTRIEMPHW